jgi:hypothetical protein
MEEDLRSILHLGNTFSPLMLSKEEGSPAVVEEIDLETARNYLDLGFTSCVSHEITAKILEALLGMEIQFNRTNVSLLK